MKRYLVSIVLTLILATSMVQAQEKPTHAYTDAYNKLMQRTQWWCEDHFGMFIHFGAHAVAASGEWVKSNVKNPNII